MAVITISRQFGSGGDEIINRVCQVMGYRLFNKRMVEEAAREAGLGEGEIIDYSEENHKVRSFFERLFTGVPAAHYGGMWPEDVAMLRTTEELRMREEDALQLVRKAIWREYQAGDVVIAGRGGQVVLKDCPNVLHVRLVAPMEDRIHTVREALRQSTHRYEADIEVRRAAQDQILQKDAASADYIKRFYGEEWDSPLLYHLVINTGRMTTEKAVQTITTLASWL